MNNLYELRRVSFVINRDGYDEGIKYAKRIKSLYLKVSKDSKKKFGKHYPPRFGFLQKICEKPRLFTAGRMSIRRSKENIKTTLRRHK